MRPGPGPARARRRDDRGAVVPFVAAVMVVLLLCAALATDIGVQRVARADMQAVADAVALDLARELDGRTVAVLDPLMPTLAERSRARNATSVGRASTVTVELGELDGAGSFVKVVGSAVPTAVRVSARTSVDFAFGGLAGVDRGGAERSAVGVANPGACFRVGSYAAKVDSATSPLLNVLLGTMLGSTVNLTAVSYDGLAGGSVTLAELVKVGQLGVGSVEELLALDHVSVGSFYLAVARVLSQQGHLAEAALLQSITVAAATPTIAIGDLLDASSSDAAALAAKLNVLDLVTGAAYLAREGSTLSIPNLGVTVPGVGTVSASLRVTEAPQPACGGAGTQARTAQVRLTVPVTIPRATAAVPGVGNVDIGPTTLSLSVDLGQAVAQLLALQCAASGPQALDVRLSSAVVGSLALTGSTAVDATVTVPLASSLLTTVLQTLGLTGLPAGTPTVRVTTTGTIGAATTPNPYTRDVSLPLPGSYTTPAGSASGVVLTGLATTLDSHTTVTLSVPQLLQPAKTYTYTSGSLFDAVVTPIRTYITGTLVQPVLDSLQLGLVAPLAKILGVQLAGADVWAIREPTCTGPSLRK